MGFFDFISSAQKAAAPLNFTFKSPDHIRYEGGKHVSGPHGGAGRVVKVEPNVSGREGYTVTIFTLDGVHPLWQDNIMMAPKQMNVVKQEGGKTVLRGYGTDSSGATFANYGLTIHMTGSEVDKCILHMHDRGVDIDYLK